MVKILVDGRDQGTDGIGRITREAIRALGNHETFKSAHELVVLAQQPFGTTRSIIGHRQWYSLHEMRDLEIAASAEQASLIHCLNFRVPMEATCPVIATIHDTFRVERPELCYSDSDFRSRVGEVKYRDSESRIQQLEALTGFVRRKSLSVHGNYIRLYMYYAMEKSTAIVTASEHVARRIATLSSSSRNKIHVIPWGIDHEGVRSESSTMLSQDRNEKFEKLRLIYVGQNRTHKRVPLLLQAYSIARATRPNIDLYLVGSDFPIRSKSDYAEHHLDEGGKIRHMGKLDDNDLRSLLRNCDCLVHLADDEGFGLTPLEALAEGCATLVSTDNIVAADILKNNAIYTDCSSPLLVADAILKLPKNTPALRKSRFLYTSAFSWTEFSNSLVSLYETCIYK